MKLRTVIGGAATALGLLALALSAAMVLLTDYTHEAATFLVEALDSTRAAEELQLNLRSYSRLDFLMAEAKDPVLASRQEEILGKIREWAKEIDRHVDSAEEKVLVDQIHDAVDTFLADHGRAYASGQSPLQVFQLQLPALKTADELIEKLIRLNMVQGNSSAATISRHGKIADRISWVVLPVVGAICLFLIVALRHMLYRPLLSLGGALARFGSGDESIQAPEAGAQEISALAKAFNEMTATITSQRRARMQFVAGVAHDLRNPLSALKMASEILRDEPKLSLEGRQIVDIVLGQTSQLERLVSDLLDTSRIETGRLEIKRVAADLCELVRTASELYRSASPQHSFEVVSPTGGVIGDCDPSRIGQVVNNLLSNAVKYSPDGGKISIRVGEREGFAEIEVSDEGFGVESEDASRIFEPFYRAKATEHCAQGVGLGLSASRRIVEAHGGSITLIAGRSRGATFLVRLPLPSSQSQARNRAPGAVATPLMVARNLPQ